MKSITLIGSVHKETTIVLPDGLHPKRRNTGMIQHEYGGKMFLTTYHLASLGLVPTFITKLGNDYESVDIWNQLNDMGAVVYSNPIDKPTPKKVTIIDPNGNMTDVFDKPQDFYFQLGDFIPHNFFRQSDYSVCDIKDDLVLSDLFKSAPDTRWILCNYIPDKPLLKNVYGLVIDYNLALTLGSPSDYERICYRLNQLGVQFVIIHLYNQGIYVYQDQMGIFYPSQCVDKGYFNGTLPAFLAGVMTGLAADMSIEMAANLGLKAEHYVYTSPSITSEQFKELLRR